MENPETTQKYQIVAIPLIIFKDGEVKERETSLPPKQAIIEKLNSLL